MDKQIVKDDYDIIYDILENPPKIPSTKMEAAALILNSIAFQWAASVYDVKEIADICEAYANYRMDESNIEALMTGF
jgi:hypothetical protein